MNKEEKTVKSLIFFALGLISIFIGMYLWVKFPTKISHVFCVYYGGEFIGMGREILKNE